MSFDSKLKITETRATAMLDIVVIVCAFGLIAYGIYQFLNQ